MKCPKCRGTGIDYDNEFIDVCENCDGIGIVNPLTNEEWIKSCSTEEFAKWLYDLIMHKGNIEWYEDLLDYREDTMDYRADYHLIEMWLKEEYRK